MASTEAARRKKRNATERERRRLLRLHLYEERAHASGFRFVGGIDEVGRGPLAGPVVAACVVTDGPLRLRGLNDSKQVIPELRQSLAAEIKTTCVAWAVGEANVEEIDRLNIYWASILAMERALAALHIAPDYLLTDAVRIKSWIGAQEPVIKGDAKCATVAAASIVAGGSKVLPTWLIVTYLLHTFGELCLSPVGLSYVTKLAPKRLVGQIMGMWFLSLSLGNLLAGNKNFESSESGGSHAHSIARNIARCLCVNRGKCNCLNWVVQFALRRGNELVFKPVYTYESNVSVYSRFPSVYHPDFRADALAGRGHGRGGGRPQLQAISY